MTEQLIYFFLTAGLNLPVYLELYKHSLSHRKALLRIIITIAYWAAAYETQTIAALAAIIYLYFAYYKNFESENDIRNINLWKISIVDMLSVAFKSFWARIALLLTNLLYVIMLDKLLGYAMKQQDIVTYYMQSESWLRAILAVEIIIIAPIVEEFVFRYFLYDKILVNKMPRYMAALISAGLFTVLHFNVSGIPTFLGLGLFCTLMYEKKGYWGAVIAHGVSNAFTLFFLQ
jgi:membrane protease YdiL (CAAX protease family)